MRYVCCTHSTKYRSSCLEVFCKKGLRYSENFTANYLYQSLSFFFLFFKNLYQMFFCEFCEISNKNFFYRTLLVAAFNVLISFCFPGIIRKFFQRASPPISHQSFPLNPLGDLQHPQTPSSIQVLYMLFQAFI